MRRYLAPLFALALIALAFGLRWPHLGRQIWSKDEGVTFTMGQQLLAGDVLYRDAADHRSPLLPYLKAAVFWVAGDWNAPAVHVVFAFGMALIAILLWRLARRLGDEPAGVAAALLFSVVGFTYLDAGDALAASTGWAVAFFSTAGYALLAWAWIQPAHLRTSRFVRGLLSGLAFGASIACKQPGFLDFAAAVFVIGVVAWRSPPGARRDPLVLGAGLVTGAALPMMLFAAYYASQGAYHDFVYYALTYNTKIYVPEVPALERWAMMAEPFKLAWSHVPEVLVLGVAAAILGLFGLSSRSRLAHRAPLLPWLFLGWTAAGIVSTGLSGRTFSHYSAQLAPGLCLAGGWTVAQLFRIARNRERALVLRGCAGGGLMLLAIGLIRDCQQRSRELGPDDAFVRDVGRLISAHTSKSDRVFVWGYSPELYQFSRRLPASRFIYTNFLTGLIPWTNLDPLVDTSYAVTPDAWEQLADDLKRHPPALIVDSGGTRGYLKYPFHDQPLLEEMVQHHFAEVAVGSSVLSDAHLYRRLDPAPAAELDSSLSVDPEIHVSGLHTTRHHQPARVLVNAPAGVRRIELYGGRQPLAAVSHPLSQRVSVAFVIDPWRVGADEVRAVITTGAGRVVSVPFNFAEYAGRIQGEPLPGPSLQIGELLLPPIEEDRPIGEMRNSPLHPNTWRLDAPVTLEYRCPAQLKRISFLHGPYPETQGRSDGYDVQVFLEDVAGNSILLHEHRMLPRTIEDDRHPQTVNLELPPHQEGRLIFRFLAGESNEPNFDWIYFGQLTGNCDGPMLMMGDRPVLPSVGVNAGQKRMEQQANGTWLAHAPARLEWVRPAELSALTMVYGLEEGSYTAPEGHSDGVVFALELVEANGTRHPLFKREITPFNHPEHRGPQKTRVEIPAKIGGNLVMTVDPGPRGDTSWDWAYIGKITCEGPGPNIVISSQREIMPLSSRIVDANGPASKYDGDNRWGAHADAELVYARPATLTRVTFEYGLPDAAAHDENGKRRTDGIDAVVEFEAEGFPRRELFRRHLDPFANPADMGTQASTVNLPPHRAGRLVFRLTPGPSGNNAFDWAYWGRFTGKEEP